MAVTVTATQGNSTANGMVLTVKVLTGQAASPVGASTTLPASGGQAPQKAITPNATGSWVYGASQSSPQATLTINGSSTQFTDTADSTNNEEYGTCRSTATTTSGTPVTVGWSAPTTTCSLALLEILKGTGLAEDASSPASVSTTAATTVTTASFTPPAGSLLVAMVASDGGAAQTTMTLSDTGGHTWTEQVKDNSAGNDYVGVWTAPVPAAGASAPALPLQAPALPPRPPAPPPGQVISAPVAYQRVVTLSGSGTLTAGPGVGGQPQLITGIAQPPQPAQPPAARLIGVTPAAFISGATLSGSGTLTASYTVTGVPSPVIQPVAQPPQPPQPPPGQITGSAPVITYTVGASLSGSGTLTAAWTVYGIPPYVTTPVAQPPQPAPPPPGRVISAPPALLGSAALTGSGTLAAAPFFSAAAVLSGAGTLTAGPGAGGFPVIIQAPLPQPAQPPLPPPGRVLQAPPALLLGSATLAGSGTLAALPFFSAAAALSGQGTLTAAYTVAGAPPYIIVAVIQPPAPAQPPPGRLLGVPPPPPPPVLQSATIAATVSDQATTTATVSEQASITASVT